jgi:hypothetical protein
MNNNEWVILLKWILSHAQQPLWVNSDTVLKIE